jgi:hypothetical protein
MVSLIVNHHWGPNWRKNSMRKWIGLMTVFLLIIVTGPAQALQITMTDDTPRYWGGVTVTYSGLNGGNETTVGAGRFYTAVDYGEKEIDTFSYCVDLGNYFFWNKSYTAFVGPLSETQLQAAWLVSQYDPFTGKQYQGESFKDKEDEAKLISMTLQLAIWDTLYEDSEFSIGSNPNLFSGGTTLFDEMIGSLGNIGAFDGSGFFVADISGQDQLVAAPVPEPGTMLLMGMGLLGLGVVGRKRLK